MSTLLIRTSSLNFSKFAHPPATSRPLERNQAIASSDRVVELFSAKKLDAIRVRVRFKSDLSAWDFNGDGEMDVAVLVKQRSTGKLGIASVHGATNKVSIVGAGVGIGNGGDNFDWMDSWQVYAKARAAHAAGESGVPRLRGDALLVSKSEAASTPIYWNGKRYVWFQQGD
jgi:hypothetical protein